MELFKNLVYEYQKGMRDLVLYTCECSNLSIFESFLKKLKIPYTLFFLAGEKVNLFFGSPVCLEIIAKFSSKELNKLTPQEDFILGIMLGYSRNEQYKRILSKI